MAVDSLRKRKKRKKSKGTPHWVVEEATSRDIAMASAYGGVAKPRVRKTFHRFATVARDRAGLQTSAAAVRPPKVGNLTGNLQDGRNIYMNATNA